MRFSSLQSRLKQFPKSKKGVSLVEVLISIVIIAVVSASGWLAISVLSPTADITRNRIEAENLITQSQE